MNECSVGKICYISYTFSCFALKDRLRMVLFQQWPCLLDRVEDEEPCSVHYLNLYKSEASFSDHLFTFVTILLWKQKIP